MGSRVGSRGGIEVWDRPVGLKIKGVEGLATICPISLSRLPWPRFPQDDDRTVVTEIRERFNRRKDKLRERRVYPLKV